MAQATILLANEVKAFSEMPGEFPGCSVNDILEVEMAFFRSCLGMAFYEEMKTKLADYSAAAKWVAGAYAAGAIVKYEGIYRRAKVATSALPTSTDWELAPKFTTTCLENLWCNFLGRLLALKVWARTIGKIQAHTTGLGLVQKTGENFIPASKDAKNSLFASIDLSINETYDNLLYFIKNNNADSCFDKSKPIAKDCCKTCGELVLGDCNECVCDNECGDGLRKKRTYWMF